MREDTSLFYKHLVENSLGLICCHDCEGRLLMINPAAAGALDYTPAEIVGHSLRDFMPADVQHRLKSYLHRVISKGEAHGYLTLLTRSGERVTWVYRNSLYPREGGPPIVIGHAQDMTWRFNMERNLKESQDQFKALFEDAPVAYQEIDHRGIVIRVNKAECELLERDKQEILGCPAWEFVIPEQRASTQREIEQMLSGVLPAASQLQREYARPSGERLFLNLCDNVIRSASGEIVGIRSTLLNVTEQRRAEVAMRKVNAELDRRVSERTRDLDTSHRRMREFVYTVSHDLQEPLRAVIGFGALLRERYGGSLDADGVEFLDYMTSGASRMSALIADLLAYSRVIHDEEENRPTSLETVLQAAQENLAAAIESANAIVTHGTLPEVSVNPTRIIQLFQNLISNAIKYRSTQAPEVRVTAERKQGEWVVTVADNGIGVEEADRERIFELFKRGRTHTISGSGAGLAICRAIVNRRGGEIWVEPGFSGGSRFRFSVPDRLPGTGTENE